MNARKIETLEELRHARRVLQLKQEVTKREFAHSLGTTRTNLGSFLVKKVALPVGGAILAGKGMGALLSRFADNDDDHYEEHHYYPTTIEHVEHKEVVREQKSKGATVGKALLPVAIQILRSAIKYHQTGNGMFASVFGHQKPKPEANVVATPAAKANVNADGRAETAEQNPVPSDPERFIVEPRRPYDQNL